MYAHERSLVKRLADKPFALLGINSDPKDVVKKARKDENLSWRSWWDGGDTSGPIATRMECSRLADDLHPGPQRRHPLQGSTWRSDGQSSRYAARGDGRRVGGSGNGIAEEISLPLMAAEFARVVMENTAPSGRARRGRFCLKINFLKRTCFHRGEPWWRAERGGACWRAVERQWNSRPTLVRSVQVIAFP